MAVDETPVGLPDETIFHIHVVGLGHALHQASCVFVRLGRADKSIQIFIFSD